MKPPKYYGYLFFLFSSITLGLRLFLNVPPSNLEGYGLSVWLDIGLVLILFTHINLTAISIGRKVLEFFHFLTQLTSTEQWILAHLLGLAIFGSIIFFSGLIGLFTEKWLFLLLALLGLSTCNDWITTVQVFSQSIKKLPLPSLKFSYENILWAITAGLLITTSMIAFLPVWDFDGLMYHLTILSVFLREGRIYFEPSLYRSASPFLVEMLFTPGIMFHLESVTKLISLTYTFLLVISVYCFGKRFFTKEISLFATGILLGNPAAPIWAASANVDFAWSVYQFWGIYALMFWITANEKRSFGWLILAGIMTGFASSIKYLAVPLAAILALLIIISSYNHEKSFKKAFQSTFIFGSVSLLVMSPWYIKNWLWTGNPVYPLLFGGSNWDGISRAVLSEYASSFGLGQDWRKWPLLPYYIITNPKWFGPNLPIVFNPLLWLGLCFSFLTKWKKYNILIVYVLLGIFVWLLGIQIVRFLIPVSALLAITSACVIESFPKTPKKITLAIIIGLGAITFYFQASVIIRDRLYGFYIGQQSASDILNIKAGNYPMTSYIENNLGSREKVLFLWDSRVYYCINHCIGDHEQGVIPIRLSMNLPSPNEVTERLRAEGITHIMLNRWDANWFISNHDPLDVHKSTLYYFENTFLPNCGKSIYSYSNGGQELFALECQ